tara:strand:+ start:213375 stop:215147 length:1773 start_codon:yes stop_codon:yes gene_type:complete
MQSRREVLRSGIGIIGLGAIGPYLGSALASSLTSSLESASGSLEALSPTRIPASPMDLKSSRPLAPRLLDPKPVVVDGFKFKSWFEGDDFHEDIPFHTKQNNFPGGKPPAPTEEVEVAVVGGGISGLTAAYALRDFNPVVFELHDRFGGNAQGGTINGSRYSLGSAYIITPDEGSTLDNLYRELGFYDVVKTDAIPAPVEIDGVINDDIWTGLGVPKADIPAYKAYANLVAQYADDYPDIPFPEQWMIDLDQISLRQHIEEYVLKETGLAVPAALAAAVQAYCYSSFSGGWEEISATLGWNFLAAEEFGRWVLPGGNAWIAEKLWEGIHPLDRKDPSHAPHLRSNQRVVDLRVQPDGRSLLTWVDSDGEFTSMLAKQVVMACPKNIARAMIPDLEQDEPDRYRAMRLSRRAYMVANVVLDCPVPDGFYDIFLLDNPSEFPMTTHDASNFWQYTDVTNGSYAPGPHTPSIPRTNGILNLFWPLPYENARFDLILHDPINTYATALASKLRSTLKLVGLTESNVQEIRFARWGHALPLARIGFLSEGIPALIRAPYRENVHFANQDNWALPAIENSMLDALEVAETIRGKLG